MPTIFGKLFGAFSGSELGEGPPISDVTEGHGLASTEKTVLGALEDLATAQAQSQIGSLLGHGMQNATANQQIWTSGTGLSVGGSIYGGPTGIGGGSTLPPPVPAYPPYPGKRPPGADGGPYNVIVGTDRSIRVEIKKGTFATLTVSVGDARYIFADGEFQREREKEMSPAEQVKQSFDRHMALKREREKNGKAKR